MSVNETVVSSSVTAENAPAIGASLIGFTRMDTVTWPDSN